MSKYEIVNNFLTYSKQDNESIRTDGQNDESLFGSNGRLYNAQSNVINSSKTATSSNCILIVSLMSLVCSVTYSKLLSFVV